MKCILAVTTVENLGRDKNKIAFFQSIGEGGFLRGFVDWIVQIVNEKTDFAGEVVVVQPIDKGM